jgi:hypothetical protein
MNPGRIISLFILLELIIVAASILMDGFTISALQTTTRFSGRLSLFLFSAIFLMHSKPATLHSWLSEKFYLLFAIVHGIHLVELLAFNYLAEVKLIPTRVAGGFLAYAFIFAMPVLSNYARSGKISIKRFFTFEAIFLYFTWLIFFLTYLPRVQGKLPSAGGSYAEHVALLGWVSTMLGIKLTSMLQFQKAR